MIYDAITFDTQTVEHNGYHFDGGLLAQLKQFANGPIDVVLSEIVIKELFRHLTEKTRSAKDALLAARRKAADLGIPQEENEGLPELEVKEISKRRLDGFLREIGAAFVKVDDVSMREVVDLYFGPAPPFSASGKKKNEFPDAIALLSLEAWAKKGSKKLLAVSGDKDWIEYASGSGHIDVVVNLTDALDLLQKNAEEARETVKGLLSIIDAVSDSRLVQEFGRHIDNVVSAHVVSADADSIYEVEADQVDLRVTEFHLLLDDGGFEISIVQVGSDRIVAQIPVNVSFEAEASFSLSIYDSIDKDYTSAGHVSTSVEDDAEFIVLVTFEQAVVPAGYSVTNIEIVDGPRTVNFGTIEPDYEPEYDEDYQLPDRPPLPHDPMDDDVPF